MHSIYFIPLALLLLFISKRGLTLELGRLVHRLGGGHNTLIIVWSLIFLPGTVIHELSHFFFAILTGARTGKIEIFPEYLEETVEDEERGGEVALGYIQTQRLNPLQGFLVGTAPFVVGMILLIWLTSLIRNSYETGPVYLLLFQAYLFFTIANSFFPSWSDIRQTLTLVIFFLVMLIASWILGFQVFFRPGLEVLNFVETMLVTLLVSIAVNLIIIGVIFLLNKIFRLRR